MAQAITATMQIKAEEWKEETTREETDSAKEKETRKQSASSETMLPYSLDSLQITRDKSVSGGLKKKRSRESKAGQDRMFGILQFSASFLNLKDSELRDYLHWTHSEDSALADWSLTVRTHTATGYPWFHLKYCRLLQLPLCNPSSLLKAPSTKT